MRSAFLVLAMFVVVAFTVTTAAPAARGDWPSPVFEDNLVVEWNPLRPTSEDRVTIVIRTIVPNTFIKGATVYVTTTDAENVTQGPFPNPMAVGDPPTQATYGVRSYDNAWNVSFYVVAWDHLNDWVTSRTYGYRVEGAPSLGWRHPGFEENVAVSWFPPLPEPHDEVNVSIRSREENVQIGGADLYIRYVYQSNPPKAGGFRMRYVNATDLNATIPGFPPGTQVIFWIIAWDKDVDTRNSTYYVYNLSVDKYTKHENLPWPAPETYVGSSIGLATLVPVALYFADTRRRRRSNR